VTHPERPAEAIRTLEVEPGALSTSGAYQDRFIHEGVEYGHILDPRTGRPVQGQIRSVTVWTPEAVRGDIISTALFVLEREEGRRLIERGPRATALLVEGAPEDLHLQIFHSGPPGFREAGSA